MISRESLRATWSKVRRRLCHHRHLKLERLAKQRVYDAELLVTTVSCVRCGHLWILHSSPRTVAIAPPSSRKAA